MKYFRHLFDSTAEALVSVFYENRHADKVIEYYFRNNKKWGKRDRQFVADSVYGCVRWWNKYLYITGAETDPPIVQANKAIAAHLLMQDLPLPEWYAHIHPATVQDRLNSLKAPHLIHAVPEWMYELGKKELGEEVWNKTLEHLNKPAEVILRVNTLKTTREELIKALALEEIIAEPIAHRPDALKLVERTNVFKTESFQKGHFEVQDASSQRVAPLLAPKAGERVVDACAGAGGKSLHMASLMENKGKIVCLDVIDWKLGELMKRAARDGVNNIEPRVIESSKTIKRLKDSADAVLLDVPCSGLGVLKRNPDSKWKLTVEKIEELRGLQREILQEYSAMAKPKGRLVYATCSVLPSENQEQVEHFLKHNPNWKKIEDHSILPQDEGFDGFYMCLLQKTT